MHKWIVPLKTNKKRLLSIDVQKWIENSHDTKSKKNVNFNVLNQDGKDCELHHIDKKNTVYIPGSIHRVNKHILSKDAYMLKINMYAWDYLESSVL